MPSIICNKSLHILEPQADVNRQTTTNDHTVLSLACAGGHLAVVELLLAFGADPTHKLKVSRCLICHFECSNRPYNMSRKLPCFCEKMLNTLLS